MPPSSSPSGLTTDFLAGLKGRGAATAQRGIREPAGPREEYNPEFEPVMAEGLQPFLSIRS